MRPPCYLQICTPEGPAGWQSSSAGGSGPPEDSRGWWTTSPVSFVVGQVPDFFSEDSIDGCSLKTPPHLWLFSFLTSLYLFIVSLCRSAWIYTDCRFCMASFDWTWRLMGTGVVSTYVCFRQAQAVYGLCGDWLCHASHDVFFFRSISRQCRQDLEETLRLNPTKVS